MMDNMTKSRRLSYYELDEQKTRTRVFNTRDRTARGGGEVVLEIVERFCSAEKVSLEDLCLSI